MAQRMLTLRVRPARVVVLIDSNAVPADFVLAVRFLSQLWGGRFSPILAVDPAEPDELTEFRLGSVRPDFVFGLNIDDDAWRPVVQRACQPRDFVKLTPWIAENVRREQRLDFIHSDRAIIASFETRMKPSAIVRTVKVVSSPLDSEWSPYCAAMFGVHHESLNEKYRDEQVTFDAGTQLDLIALHDDFVDGFKKSWLDTGSFGLSPHHVLNPPNEPTIVIVKELIPDLCLFWNLRLAADATRPSWTIPVAESQIDDSDVQQALRGWLLGFQNYGELPNYCIMTSQSLRGNAMLEKAENLRATLQGTAFEYVDYEVTKNRLPSVLPYEYITTWPVELRRSRLEIVPPAPRVFRVSGNSARWFVDIVKDNKTGRALRDMQFPSSPVIPELLDAPAPPHFVHTAVPRFGDGLDSINIHCDASEKVVHLEIPRPAEVLEEILRESGYEIVRDEKRGSYHPTIKRFGGLQMAAKAMLGQAGQILEILRSGKQPSDSAQSDSRDAAHQATLVAQGHTLTPRQIKSVGKLGNGILTDEHYHSTVERALRNASERVKRIGAERFRRHAHRHVPEQITLQALLEHWADKTVLRRRWVVGPCSRCDRVSFVGRFRLSSPPRCRHCGNHVPMKEVTAIGYSLHPSVRHSLSEGLATVVLAGRFLRNMTGKGFFWLPGIKYCMGGEVGDIDLVACCDGHLVFGECKTLTKTPHDAVTWTSTVDQFLELASVANKCGRSLVVLAAMVDEFPKYIRDRLEGELKTMIPFLLLTKHDLEEGYRSKNSEQRWPPIGLDDLVPTPFPDPPAMQRHPGKRTLNLGWGHYTKIVQAREADEFESQD